MLTMIVARAVSAATVTLAMGAATVSLTVGAATVRVRNDSSDRLLNVFQKLTQLINYLHN